MRRITIADVKRMGEWSDEKQGWVFEYGNTITIIRSEEILEDIARQAEEELEYLQEYAEEGEDWWEAEWVQMLKNQCLPFYIAYQILLDSDDTYEFEDEDRALLLSLLSSRKKKKKKEE